MDLRCSSRGSWAWLALGAAVAPRGEAAWQSEDNAQANEISGSHSSGRGLYLRDEGREIGHCPNPCPECPRPVCPKPHCPPLPPIPRSPQPLVNLTCPESRAHCPTSCAKQSPVRKPRPPGYEGWPTAPVGIYKLYKNKASWLDANYTCFMEGAHLVILNTKAEVEVLKNMMVQEEISYLNIGFHDTYQEGQYLSVLGNPMDWEQTKMWAPGQPNGGPTENCAVMYSDGQIHDYHCTVQFPFVCEVP